MKSSTKHARNAAKALKRSQRNSHKHKNAQQRRTEDRKARVAAVKAHQADTDIPAVTNKTTVAQLRALCELRGIHTTTKMRRDTLVELLAAS